jgi:glycosyltransferase involved in cell wall biosynthesis
MLIGCVITYNDMPLVRDCIESLYNKVDKIICVDGRYIDFPGSCDYSTDGTLEYLKNLSKVKVIIATASEVDKRNRYLEELLDGDIVLNLDADEVLVGDIPPLTSDFGIIELVDGHCKKVQVRATRFFKYRAGMRYRDVHYTLYYKNRMINSLKKVVNPDFSSEYVKGCHILHNWHLRGQLRLHNKSRYYKKLIQSERGYPR